MTWGGGLDRFRDLVGDELGVDRTGHEAGVDEAAATNGYDLWTWVGREQRELNVLALRWEACAQAGAIPLDALQRDWHAKAQRLELELEGLHGRASTARRFGAGSPNAGRSSTDWLGTPASRRLRRNGTNPRSSFEAAGGEAMTWHDLTGGVAWVQDRERRTRRCLAAALQGPKDRSRTSGAERWVPPACHV